MDWFRSPDFRDRALHLMKTHHLPGLCVAVVQDGQTASLALGHASLDPPVECTPDTLFDIASCSKSFTGVAVALLVQDEEHHPRVRWDTPVNEILLEFVLPDADSTRSVTLDDIVSHRTGMPRAERPDTPQTVTQSLRHLPPVAPLRTKHLYNHIMFTVAAHLVAQHTGAPFSRFLNERIFGPLGMRSTSLQPSGARASGLADRIATGYRWDRRARSYRGTPAPECHEGEGAGSIVTTAGDLLRWVEALMRREGPVITRAVYAEVVRQRSMCNPRSRGLRPWTSPAYYGAGVEVYYYRGRAVVTHSGGIDGFGSRFALLPEEGFGVVVCGNAEGAAAVSGALTRELVDEFLGVPKEQRSYRAKLEKKSRHKMGERASPDDDGEDGNEDGDEDDGHGPSDESDSDSESAAGDEEETVALEEHELQRYTGRYHHPGYHGMTVQIRDGKLFIDGRDRSFACTIELEARPRGGTDFRATLRDEMGLLEEWLAADFVVDDGAREAVRMGLRLEPQLKQLIWFERVES
ncbi:Beta-lactamase [Escovopsis weberi]|uniref:Beta-lactamase n=1 Tax=Escovopsis weberi TaxID=150374 RepID=A0A0N0RTN4_ESCWE|nr:Beta-lactamase [Escovopsis weberi]